MKRSGFTLVELLVVVAVIAVLMSLIFPTLRQGVRRARQLQCVNNLRQLAAAMHAYATRHRGVLPPTRNPGTEWWQRAPWIGAEGQWGSVEGALVSYVGGADMMRRLVRCPALPLGVPTSGIGSNGRFDYATVEGWGGFRIANAPATAKLVHNGRTEILPTPLFLEEDPWFHINRTHIDPFHGNKDRLGTWHDGQGSYAAVDGSVQSYRATFRDAARNLLGPVADEWFVTLPGGRELSVGGNWSGPYGFWNNF